MVEPIDLDDGPFDPYAPTDQDIPVEPVEAPKRKRVEPPPLPRLWKVAPEPEEEEPVVKSKSRRSRKGDEAPAEPAAAKAKPKKKKKAAPVDDVAATPGKLAETPVLDTYESRQRARWLIGGVAGAIGLFSLIMIIRSFGSGGTEVVEDHPMPEPGQSAAPVAPVASGEKEAKALLESARQADRIKKTAVALDLLKKLVRVYPGTPSCKSALDAIDRDRRGLSMFGADASSVVVGPKPPPSTNPVPPPVGPTPSAPPPTTAANPTAPAPPKVAEPNAPTPPKAGVAENLGPTGVETNKGVYSAITKPIPNGFHAKPGATVHKLGWPNQIIRERDDSIMVLVPAGSFTMGRADGEENERPTHPVDMTTYYIDEHEVTVRQYRQFLKESKRSVDASKLAINDDLPMTGVSQLEARAFNDWAGTKLPTEAQWEFAARSYDGRISYWNGDMPRKDPAKGLRPMDKAMSLPSDISPYGAFDMAANAWEWTADWYDSRYFQGIRGTQLNPTGAATSPAKPKRAVVKGGSKSGILTWRDGVEIQKREPHIGFRGVLAVDVPPPVANPSSPTTGGNKPDGNQPF